MTDSPVTSELARRDAIQAGDLVFYDAIHGSVPCRVISRQGQPYPFSGETVTLKVTGGRHWAYPRGTTFTTRVGPFVRSRRPLP